MHLDLALSHLTQAFRQGRLAHAYLIVGAPRGVAGELAVRVVQMLACRQPHGPCGACDACRQVAERTWPDAIWIKPEKKSRIISIDQLRATLLPRMSQTSFGGGWKVGVFVAADRLFDAAANAFLKMLEEPPPLTLFLLLTDEPQALLPTVRSRCQRLDLTDAPLELAAPLRRQVLEVLAGEAIQGPVAAMAAGERLMGVLRTLQDEAERDVKEESQGESEAVNEEKEAIQARVSARYRELRATFLLTLQRWYRDLLLLRAGGAPDRVHYQEQLDTLRARAPHLTLAQALANVDGIDILARQQERSLSDAALLAYWLDRLRDGAS